MLGADAAKALPDAVLAPVRQALGLSEPGVLAYQDVKRGQQRALRIARDATGAERLTAFWVAGDAAGEAWLRALLEADQSLPGPGSAGERIAHLQATLKCGTNCGSCLPALRNLAKTAVVAPALG